MKKLSILGITGSIGRQTLDLVQSSPEHYTLQSCAASGNDIAGLAEIIREYRPERVYLEQSEKVSDLRDALAGAQVEVITGPNGLVELSSDTDLTDIVVAVTGIHGLAPTLAGIETGHNIILANKETLIAGGELIDQALSANPNASLISADSEHVGVHQCLERVDKGHIERIILTASGGPFWSRPELDLSTVTPEMALNHPTWNMGAKITIDSATMMNKGLEVIEAQRLFGLSYDQIDILVHPQSIVHAAVETIDGSLLAQMSSNDMRLPLQYALEYPERRPVPMTQRLDLTQLTSLEFHQPNRERFPAIDLAYQAGRAGGTYPAALVFADQCAVERFLSGEIRFTQITDYIRHILDIHQSVNVESIEQLYSLQEQISRDITEKL